MGKELTVLKLLGKTLLISLKFRFLINSSSMALKLPSTCKIETIPAKSPRKIDLGPLPSPAEVDSALSALQGFLQESFSLETISKWMQPVMNSCDSSILDSGGSRLICKGFQWLLTDPNFKGLVISLCLDKKVWDAINNIGIVEKLQELPSSEGGSGKPGSSVKGGDFGSIIIGWILQMSLTKIGKLIENFVLLLNDTLRYPGKEKLKPEKRDDIDEKIQSSLGLAMVTMLIVLVARAQIA